MDSVKLRLTTPQMRNYKSGKPFQLSYQQLTGHSQGKHDVEMPLPNHHTKLLMKKLSVGKGYRFSQAHTAGGAISRDDVIRKAKNTFNKVANFVKPAIPVIKEIALPIIKDLARDAITKTVKGGRIPVEGGALKDGIPQPLYTTKTTDRIMTHGLTSHKSGNKNGLMQGGSFLPLG